MTTFAIHTLGCKVNFYESAWIRERLLAVGANESEVSSACPDWIIVNTCTVTGRADRQSRQLIYRAGRRFPESKILVTGCYADRDPETLRSLPGVTCVVPNAEKPRIPGIVISCPPDAVGEEMTLAGFGGHVRAYLMVQNGCNARCAYCVIPRVRGKSRSKPIETVLRELDALARAEHPEVVLCGIHLGLYGRDLSPRKTLGDLLRAIEAHPFPGHVRISSLEPMEFHEEIIEVAAASKKICPHFHIPLQNGDEEILRRMNRPYTPAWFERLIARLKAAIPGCTLGSDIMVGFPGETDEAFERCLGFVSGLPLSYLHVFPYSQRPGTPSASFPDKVPERVKKVRVARLLALAREKRAAFHAAWLGRTDTVIFEQQKGGGAWSGKSLHYLPVRVPSRENLLGRTVNVTFTTLGKGFVRGVL